MRNAFLIVASVAALMTFGPGSSLQAQQSVPDTPQPQKKAAAKPQSTPADNADSKPSSAKDENAFPEAVSKAAAASSASHPTQTGTSKKKATADENPFPETVSRDAAKAAGNDPTPAPAAKRDIPAGVSSSQSDDSPAPGENEVADPARSKKDTEVGGYYLKTGDYKGALLRYQEAAKADATNVEAIFGLAETQRMLKNNAEAARDYQLYLEILPNGPRAKQALKALKTLPAGS